MQKGQSVITGIRLEFEGGRTALASLPDIQAALQRTGTGVWPLPLDNAPDDVQRLLGQTTLTNDETTRLRAYFLMSRERLLEVISASGRPPNVLSGGELETGRQAVASCPYELRYFRSPSQDRPRGYPL